MIQQTARQIVSKVEKLMRSVSNPVSLPSYIVCSLLFASYALLRILKSFITILSEEREEAKSSLFLAIGLLKSLSIDTNDMCSKSCMYLTQLWNSSRAFKKADGTDMLDLRARSRLNGSHVVDAILWWREEFDPHFKVQMQNLKHSALGECCTYISRIAKC
jgi:predicted ATPase